MEGNKDKEGVIFDLLVSSYGMSSVCNSDIDFDEAIYSNGFINAIERGLIPILDSVEESFKMKKECEYHHLMFNNECYIMYF